MASSVLEALVRRQEDTEGDVPVTCGGGNEYDGRMGLRISAIFVILVGATLGAWFPVFARRKNLGLPEWTFFVAKFFGSGVIIATAFIHLLGPAEEALRNECLTGAITEYSWVEGIVLMSVMVMFAVELTATRMAQNALGSEHDGFHGPVVSATMHCEEYKNDHISDQPDHVGAPHPTADAESALKLLAPAPSNFAAQLTSIFILEFGIIFHSAFIGLTLAVSGSEFNTLYAVLTFHQTFEGLGLGARLASLPWPRHRRWTPYALALAYGITTPIAIAAGLGVRAMLDPGSASFLLVNGVFDSVSAGILVYTGLVELLAREFFFSAEMRRAPALEVAKAVGLVWLGAGLMALLGKWA